MSSMLIRKMTVGLIAALSLAAFSMPVLAEKEMQMMSMPDMPKTVTYPFDQIEVVHAMTFQANPVPMITDSLPTPSEIPERIASQAEDMNLEETPIPVLTPAPVYGWLTRMAGATESTNPGPVQVTFANIHLKSNGVVWNSEYYLKIEATGGTVRYLSNGARYQYHPNGKRASADIEFWSAKTLDGAASVKKDFTGLIQKVNMLQQFDEQGQIREVRLYGDTSFLEQQNYPGSTAQYLMDGATLIESGVVE